ncbi:alpha/beta hydrolase fold domain-containing protein [Streptomyces sp. BK205]|uniref:alpha/beta hydrolase n=1 Tax=Streptomyces sp. BK205 TaxID=2512164 RepID=UPI00104E65D8|nr:alpha/beta hydrolase fold domain-containing protein [Streptomyces sp. BK205]TCR26261.1 acetyl esterase/lipase [Streptomyces sp. BK205]
MVSVRDDVVKGRGGPVGVRRYSPESRARRSQTVVWVHGGAFAFGGLDQPESHAPAMAIAESGREVIAVDYRLVPRFNYLRDPKPEKLTGVRFPAPVEDVIDVFTAVAADAPGGRVILGGASAGACLVAAAALHQRRSHGAVPDGLVLAYGTFHAELPPLSKGLRARIRGRHSFAQFRASTVHRMNLNYAASSEAMQDPLAFPGGHDLTGLPRALLLDADRDSLRASGEAFHHELACAKVPVEYVVLPETRHGFLNRPRTPAFDTGISTIVDWLERNRAGRQKSQIREGGARP